MTLFRIYSIPEPLSSYLDSLESYEDVLKTKAAK